MGKSELLAHAIGLSDGFLVLRATGVESEVDLAFAGLHELLRPVLHLVDRLTGSQAEALRGALGLADHVNYDRFLVAHDRLTIFCRRVRRCRGGGRSSWVATGAQVRVRTSVHPRRLILLVRHPRPRPTSDVDPRVLEAWIRQLQARGYTGNTIAGGSLRLYHALRVWSEVGFNREGDLESCARSVSGPGANPQECSRRSDEFGRVEASAVQR